MGLFEVPTSAFAEIANAGFNSFANFWADTDNDKLFLSTAADRNLLGIVGIDSSQVRGSRSSTRSFVQKYAASLAGGTSQLAYQLPDEALSMQGVSIQTLADVRNSVKSVDGSALMLYEDWTREAAAAAKNTYDIFSWDAYPIGANGESIENWRTDLRQVVATVRPKPLWVTLQAYVSPPEWLEPSKDELRVMAYTAIANGAKGLLAYHYCGASCGSYGSDVWDYPQLWRNLKNLMAELRSVSSILTLPDSTNVTATANVTGIDVKVKQGGGKYYVIAANWKSTADYSGGHYAGQPFSNVSFSVVGVSSGSVKTIAPASSASTASLSNGRFLDSLGAYGAKIYELTP